MISYLLSDAKFWTAIAFVIFLLATFRPIKSILIKNLDDKIKSIKENIGEAEKVKEDAEKLLIGVNENEKKLGDMISEINQNAKSKIEFIKNEMTEKLKQKTNRHKELTELKIKQLEQEAITEIKDMTAHLTIEVVKNIFKSKLDDKVQDTLLQSSLKDLSSYSKN